MVGHRRLLIHVPFQETSVVAVYSVLSKEERTPGKLWNSNGAETAPHGTRKAPLRISHFLLLCRPGRDFPGKIYWSTHVHARSFPTCERAEDV